MPLVSIKDELRKASRSGYAVPLYDVFDPNAVDGLVKTLEETPSPCIIGVYSGSFKDANIEAFAAYIRTRAAKLDAPVSLMLDHGEGLEQARYAIELGFTDVMYDGSRLPFEENADTTAQIVAYAHALGIGVEAELGHVGVGASYDEYGGQRKGFTEPQAVVDFSLRTQVDFLAIAFGNAHGNYQSQPKLDLDLVRQIHQLVDIPLVMHGGSGLDDQEYRAVIAAGIAKINYFTGINNEATARMIQAAAGEKPSMFGQLAVLRQAYTDVCAHYLQVFGAAGKV